MSAATPLLTPNDQERALIAMLRHFEDRNEEEDGPSDIMIKISRDCLYDVDLDDEDYDEDKARKFGWTVGLDLGGFHAEASDSTFAAAWDAMVADGDTEIDHRNESAEKFGWEKIENSLLSDLVRLNVEITKSLTAQETELIMNLRRRAAKRDDYLMFLEFNAEDRPGEWRVIEKKEVVGVSDTFAAAWDERF